MATLKKAGIAGGVCSVMTIIGIVVSMGNIRTNEEGLEIMGNAESCRRAPYYCPAGDLTDGVGNTHGVYIGTVKTDKQIADDWTKNIQAAEKCINGYFNGMRMGDNAFSAMTSAAFNMGCVSLRTYYSPARKTRIETSIHKNAQKGNWPAMCNNLLDFVNGGGKKLPGLVVRREKEKALCLKADK